jgi:hypothetical protein
MSAHGLDGLSSGEAYERSQDIGVNPSTAPTLGDVIARRFGRRDVLRGALATAAIAAAGPVLGAPPRPAFASGGSPTFTEIQHGMDTTHHVAPGYDADVLIRWGDPVLPGAPPFDPLGQTAAAQAMQFGYNNDYLGYVSLPAGSRGSTHGLLCVNHEFTSKEVMFPGVGRPDAKELDFSRITRQLVEIEMAAHGASIIEIRRGADGKWAVVADSRYARRITALDTPMRLSGPAAGHDRMKTKADPTGTRVVGMLNNCAGGITPWGTYLTGEENFHGYFWGRAEGTPEERNHKRYGVPGRWYNWGAHHDRFDVGKDPHEPNRFGWIVEIDPYDPTGTPVKRTALGRTKHEGAESIVNRDGRVVLYSGDDEGFEYVYKFVSDGRVDPNNRAANLGLLDTGTLFVARFDADGTVTWLPLVWGAGPLTPDNGFGSQADVLIETRRAADLLGATPMDRPEDVEPNPVTNRVYVILTNNTRRKADDPNPRRRPNRANPRAGNEWGHIIEMAPPDGDHAALKFRWDILVQCGDPRVATVGATFNAATSAHGWFACPDNSAVDSRGRLWIATDQGSAWKKASGTADGLWALETEGDRRGTGRMFFRVPVGAELCGPILTPDDRTLFLAVQHPATDGVKDWAPFGRNSTFEDPATRWPDFKPGMPPRPAVVAVTKKDGGVIGS